MITKPDASGDNLMVWDIILVLCGIRIANVILYQDEGGWMSIEMQ
jgi:hypothetical protein